MPHAAYPTEADLIKRFQGADVDEENINLLQGVGTLSDAVNAAIAEWQGETGWTPYLAGVASSKSFDPPHVMSGGVQSPTARLSLNAPLLTVNSITVSGRACVRGVDYTLGPQNAEAEGRPYQWILFCSAVAGPAGSIVINGRWGRVAQVPDDVWDAILQKAQSTVAPDLGLLISGGLTELKVDVFTEKYGSDAPLDAEGKLWQRRWERLVTREKRVVY